MTRIKNYMGKGDLLRQARRLETLSPVLGGNQYQLYINCLPAPALPGTEPDYRTTGLLVMDSNLLHTESMRAVWRGNDSRLLSLAIR